MSKSLTDLAKEYSAELEGEFEWKPHVFPKYPSPVLVFEQGKRKIKKMNFGLIPFFEKEEKPKMVFHNARAETIAEKPSFKKSFLSQHCLIPLDSFFEYVLNADNKKQRLQFSQKNNETLLAAGIWNRWKSPSGNMTDTFSIITRSPPPLIQSLGHDRSPYFVRSGNFEWIEKQNLDANETYKVLSASAIEPEFRYQFI